MNTPFTIIKASGLSMVIFWTIILSETADEDLLFFIPLSIIPISFCCTITILMTIAPFFWSKKKATRYETVYKTYFPFYAIIVFGISFSLVVVSKFEIFPLAFFTSAFFTTLKSWSWIIKPQKTKPI